MIQISNIQTYGWEAAVRGMRNPMNSWAQSDSGIAQCDCNCENCSFDCKRPWLKTPYGFNVGPNDLALMKKLAAAGSDHRKFMRMITVTVDLTAPLYWWKEYDTYKVGTVANSCSTMHKIHTKEFTLDDFSHEHLMMGGIDAITNLCKDLNKCREMFLTTKDKEWWWQMIQLLPSSYNQKRTVMLNYEVLRNIYHARKNHKLDEWHTFCAWVESLPYAKELIVGDAA